MKSEIGTELGSAIKMLMGMGCNMECSLVWGLKGLNMKLYWGMNESIDKFFISIVWNTMENRLGWYLGWRRNQALELELQIVNMFCFGRN